MALNTQRPAFAALILLGLACLPGCTTTLVQPFDERLVSDTESLFKQASTMINEGVASSPRTDQERASLKNPGEHPGHFSKFESRYAALETDADALILRALTQSEKVDKVGDKLQAQVTRLIENSIPSQCTNIKQELAIESASLTVDNYIDLKCLLIEWQAQHTDPVLTGNTQILKRVNWELRRQTLFKTVLAIEKAEINKNH